MSAKPPSSSGGPRKDKVRILCQEIDKVNLFSQTPKTVTIEVGRTGFDVYKPRESVHDSRSTSLGTNSDQVRQRKPSKPTKDQQHRKSSTFHPPPSHHHRVIDTRKRIPVEPENYEVIRTISSILKDTKTNGAEVVRKFDKYTSTENGVVLTGKNKASQTEDVLLYENGTDPYAILDF